MKKFILPLVYACAATVLGQSGTTPEIHAPAAPERIEIDGYAAKVNARIITIGEVREALAPMLPELYRTYQGEQLDQEYEKAFLKTLNELIEQALILESFESRGQPIPDQYIQEEIQRIIKDRFKGDEALFEQTLTSQKKSRTDYMDTVRDQMVVGMMIGQEVSQRARATPEQVRNYYDTHKQENYFIPEKVKYGVIVINKGATPEEQAVKLKEAQQTREKLLNGADFAAMAQKVSEGSRATEGGQFPWMQPEDARPELHTTLKSLPAGEISDLIDTGEQLYIVKMEARRLSSIKSFEEVRDGIEKTLVAQERLRLRERWIERLKAENYVKIYVN
jgi:peptidyl-prolyl cis-trans isomerase SurA